MVLMRDEDEGDLNGGLSITPSKMATGKGMTEKIGLLPYSIGEKTRRINLEMQGDRVCSQTHLMVPVV